MSPHVQLQGRSANPLKITVIAIILKETPLFFEDGNPNSRYELSSACVIDKALFSS